jgi:hypothetical protein
LSQPGFEPVPLIIENRLKCGVVVGQRAARFDRHVVGVMVFHRLAFCGKCVRAA